jgi:hypothetical protein
MNPVHNTLYFIADDGVHGKELWALDLDVPQTGSCVYLPFLAKQ